MRFENKVVFITGGAIGFGRAFAKAFTAEGAAVVIADIDVDAGEATAAALRADGARAIAVRCDVSDEVAVEAAVARTVEEFGGVDILINNAGLHLLKYNQPFGVLPRADLRALFDVNVIGIVNCTIACRPSMSARGGGAVLNISSIAGYMSTSPYGVSKLAVRGLTIALATELAPDRIRVNAIAPGLMGTENALDGLPEEMVRDFIENRQLVHRLGLMDDIVNTTLFLCGGQAGFITGETLKVAAGYPLSI
ncbi:MAG: SDR family oxidoreductase [Actinomycetota bacterium]|nr:SDR family oxidoreductase [Actinomycetota bacterium]